MSAIADIISQVLANTDDSNVIAEAQKKALALSDRFPLPY
jgi:glycine/serine hydroxymethyltransferase